MQRKPVVTFRNRAPKPHMIDIARPRSRTRAATRVRAGCRAAQASSTVYAEAIHPWRDGRSSERVLSATADFLAGRFGPLARKPANLWRRLQMRSKLRRFGSAST